LPWQNPLSIDEKIELHLNVYNNGFNLTPVEGVGKER
jgi:hypothetical protein